MESSKLATLTWLISNSLKGLPLDCPFARQFLAWASRPEAGWSGQSGGIQYPWMCNIDTSCTFFGLRYLLQNQYTTSKNIPISSQLSKKKHQKNSKVPLLFCLFSQPKKNQQQKKPTNQKHVDFLQVWKLNVATGRGACFWKDTAKVEAAAIKPEPRPAVAVRWGSVARKL